MYPNVIVENYAKIQVFPWVDLWGANGVNLSFPFVSDRDFIAVIQHEPQLLFHLSLQSFCNPLIELISSTAAENGVLWNHSAAVLLITGSTLDPLYLRLRETVV